MPRYDFHCELCDHTWEQTKGMNAPNPLCPKCDMNKVEVLPPKGTSFVLRGPGWGSTGYSKVGR